MTGRPHGIVRAASIAALIAATLTACTSQNVSTTRPSTRPSDATSLQTTSSTCATDQVTVTAATVIRERRILMRYVVSETVGGRHRVVKEERLHLPVAPHLTPDRDPSERTAIIDQIVALVPGVGASTGPTDSHELLPAIDLTGRLVAFQGVTEVSVGFELACGLTQLGNGTFESWSHDTTGIVACGEKPPEGSFAHLALRYCADT